MTRTPTAREHDYDALAAVLRDAEDRSRVLRPLTDQHALTLADAYRVQACLVAQHVARGERIVGAKLGFTSAAMRETLGIGEPNYGRLTDRMLLPSSVLELGGLIHPRLEPEIAFRLSAHLRGPGVTAADVMDATDALMPALEVVDSRFRNYTFRLEDNTADNSSAARVALGDAVAPDGIDCALTTVTLERDRMTVARARGAASMGDPAAAVAWLANSLAGAERAIEPGDVVISGGLTRAFPIRDGQTIAACFDGLGDVRISALGDPADPADYARA